MFDYQNPRCLATLRAALAELRAAETDVSEEVSAKLAEALEAHDVVHVLFGLDISDLDEVVAHGWMMFGTTLSMREMHAVTADADHRRFARKLGHAALLGLFARALPRLVSAAIRARRMTKPWPWDGYTVYLDVPLDRVRAEFGIKLRSPRQHRQPRPRGPHHHAVVR